MVQQIQVLFLPFLACLVLTGIHAYLGIHVISRKVIFVDLALAQIAALGATVAFLLGYDPRTGGAYWFSLAFAVLAAAIFALTRSRREHVPQEAIIGLAYATAAAAAILLADISPHGAEHLHDLLAGSIVWVTPAQIARTAALYAVIGLFHFVFRDRFLLISFDPDQAYARGIRIRLWDFLFYLSFGVVITSSVQIAGVLLVFCYLVAPSVFAVMFFDDLKRRLITGWIMGTVVSAAGLLFSYDRPSGPTIMVCFAVSLVLGAIARAVVRARSRWRALAFLASGTAILAAVVLTVAFLRPGRVPSGAAAGGHSGETGAAPEHDVGTRLDELRRALRDTHENVRVRAVSALAATDDPRILPDLVDALHDQAPAVRETAALALGRIGNRSALPPLRQALRNRDEDAWVRLRLALAVAALGDPDALPVLLELAAQADAKVTRLEALKALLRLSGWEEAPPDDPDGERGVDLHRRLGRWWDSEGRRLRWDAETSTFRR